MRRFQRAPGVLVEPLGEVWAAFSPASGETLILNNESVAMLEILDTGPATGVAVAGALADDIGLPESEVLPLVEAAWQRLVEAGLVLSESAGDDNGRP